MDKKLIGLMDQKEGWTDGKKRGLDRWTTRRIGGLMDKERGLD